MNSQRKSLVLGTAAFGGAYGVTNTHGMVSENALSAIIEFARICGINSLDTALSYGSAQGRLAKFASDFRITTKISGQEAITPQVESSLQQLERAKIEYVLLHDWFKLTSIQRERSIAELLELRLSGKCAGIGISVYEASEIDVAIELSKEWNLLQVPISPLDQRLIDHEGIFVLREAGCIIQARSIFLQGLLLNKSSNPEISNFHKVCEENMISPLSACIQFIKNLNCIDEIVVGVTTKSELEAIWSEFSKTDKQILAFTASSDKNLLDPRLWSNK